MKPCIAYIINSSTHEITQTTYIPGTDLISHLIGNDCSLIDVAYSWPNMANTLYVDDEGLLKPIHDYFIFIPRSDHQPLAGNGVIVGREVETDDGWYTEPPTMTIDELKPLILFLRLL